MCRVVPTRPEEDTPLPIAESIHAENAADFYGLAEGLCARPSMKRPYKNRCGQGKAESNGFLVNLVCSAPDSVAVASACSAKAFVIQTLFAESKKSTPAGKKF